MEEIVKGISQVGVKVIVSGAGVSELAMHFIERYKMMVVKCPSKFNLRRICQATGASALVRLGAPTLEELGSCDVVTMEEIGSTKVTVFRQDKEDSAISSLVVRASTQNLLDDLERAIDDAVNTYKSMLKDPRFVPGGGATELELSHCLQRVADSTPGLDQYAIRKFAEALEVVPRTLAENAGLAAVEVISQLYAGHAKGTIALGVDAEAGVKNMAEAGVFDLLSTKLWAIRYASDVATTILRIDHLIVAKAAGGPKPRQPRAADADDDAVPGMAD